MASEKDRRSVPRRQIASDVEMELPVNPDRSECRSAKGTATDISLLGIRVRTHDLSRDECHDLVRSPFNSRVLVKGIIPGGRLESVARVFWARYHDGHASAEAYSELGLSFRDLDPAQKTALLRFLSEGN
ncbi:PilZ domain-containing protein [Candidatus Poribacteria bacterium]|nr:PilZ domain-containing protein [Candidatus Poribacteria bacterium]